MPAEPSGYLGVEPVVKLHVGIIKHAPPSLINAKLNHGVAQAVLIRNPAAEEQTESGKVIHHTYCHP
jgi:hypothetical protein